MPILAEKRWPSSGMKNRNFERRARNCRRATNIKLERRDADKKDGSRVPRRSKIRSHGS